MSLAACADLVRRGDPERWRSLAGQSETIQARLLPVYAANIEIARAPWVSNEPMIGQMRLTWWRDVCEEIASGGVVRRHEVASPLADVLDEAGAIALDAVIVARHRDLETKPFANAVELIEYLEDTGGQLALAAGSALGATLDGLSEAGFAGALANYLRAVPELKARGRRPLPSEEAVDLQELARLGLKRLAEARKARPDRQAWPLLLSFWQTRAVLTAVARSPERVFAGSLELAPAHRDWALFKARLRGW